MLTAQLGVKDEVRLCFDWQFDFTFGVFDDIAAGASRFYVDTAASNELLLTKLVASLYGGADGVFEAKGTAGIFGALIRMDQGVPVDGLTPALPPAPSQFNGNFRINQYGGGTDQRLTLAELPDLRLAALVSDQGEIKLDVDASLLPDFATVDASDRVFNLGVMADVSISQTLVDANTQDAVFGEPIEMACDKVRLDLGKLVNEFFDPTAATLQTVFSPVKPIVDFLSFPIPVISELGKALGYGTVTPLDLGILNTPFNSKLTAAQKEKTLTGLTTTKTVVGFLNALLDLKPLAQGLPETPRWVTFRFRSAQGASVTQGRLRLSHKPASWCGKTPAAICWPVSRRQK